MPLFGPPNVQKLEAKGNVKGLIKALRYEKSPFIRHDAVEALGKIGDHRAVEPLITVLKDKSFFGRKAAAIALGEIGDSRAVDPLIGALKDKNEDVRAATAQALGSIGDERALAALQCALNDESEKASLAALNALVKFGKPLVDEPTFQEREKEAVELESLFSRLTNIKIKPAYDSSGNEVSYAFNLECGDVFAAVKEIGSSGDPRAVPELCK